MRLDALMSSFISEEYKALRTVSGWESQYGDTEFVFGVSVVVVLFCFNETGGKNSHSQAEFKANAFESDPGNFFSCVISLSSLVLKLLHCTFSGCSAKINRTDIYY